MIGAVEVDLLKMDASYGSNLGQKWGRSGSRVAVGCALGVSAAILFHAAAVLSAALAGPPSSPLERWVAERFAAYYQVIDQGYSYRYYAPEPGPTPVVTATIRYADGRPDGGPAPGARGLAEAPLSAATGAGESPDGRVSRRPGRGPATARPSPWARSYARHLARTHPGSASVTLQTQTHLIPDPDEVRRGPGRAGGRSTSTPRSSTPRPNGSESSRATAPDRDRRLPGRARAVRRPRAGTPSSSRPPTRPRWA